MKLNENGKVELHDFQIENYINRTELNISMLNAMDNAMSDHIAGYLKSDLAILKEACGIEIKEINQNEK